MGGGKSRKNKNTTEAELVELRRKFEALEADRKSYYEISMKTMMENKKIIGSLREHNKAQRRQLKEMRKLSAQGKIASEVPDAEEHMDKLERHVVMIRKNLDSVTAAVEEKRSDLEKLRDQAADLEADGLSSHEASVATPQEAKSIRSLENRLDRSMIKYNETQSIRKSYEQIVERLKAERDNFDNHMNSLENTLQVKVKDLDDLHLLGNDALQARDLALRKLQQSQDRLDADRKQRERDLRARRQVASSAAAMVSTMKEMEDNRREIVARERGDLSEEEETLLRQRTIIASIQSRATMFSKQQVQAEESLDHHEEIITKLMKITGTSDVSEVVSKIVNQDEARANLEALVAENSTKIDERQSTLESMQAELEDIRFHGVRRGSVGTRRRLDDIEKKLADARSYTQVRHKKYENIAKIILDVHAGIEHLLEKLAPVQSVERFTYVLTHETLPLAVEHCERLLLSALSQISSASSANSTISSEGAGLSSEMARSTSNDTRKQSVSYALQDIDGAQSRRRAGGTRRSVSQNQRSASVLYSTSLVGKSSYEQKTLDYEDDEDDEDADNSIAVGAKGTLYLDETHEAPLSRDNIKQASRVLLKEHTSRRKGLNRSNVSFQRGKQRSSSASYNS